MKNKYYDEWELKQALEHIETNPLVAKCKLKSYINKYPSDYMSFIYYAAVLITLGEFNEAEEILNDVEFRISVDEHYHIKISKENKYKHKVNILSSRMRLLAYQEKYDELYEFYEKNKQDIGNVNLDLNPFLFFCKKKVGLLDEMPKSHYSYIFRQIINYDEQDFLEHIKKHQLKYQTDTREMSTSVFYEDFPLSEIITEIKKHIRNGIPKLCPHLYTNMYVFKFDNCGIDTGIPTDFFKVVCFHNTVEFITMCPSTGCEELPYIDLNYLSRTKEGAKSRYLSQTEKFNRRYGLK